MTESMICWRRDGEETLESYLGLDPHRIEENALAPNLDPSTGGPPPPLTPEVTGKTCTVLQFQTTIRLVSTHGAEYPEGVDGTQHPMLFHHLNPSHWSGLGPGYDVERRKAVLFSCERRRIPRSVSINLVYTRVYYCCCCSYACVHAVIQDPFDILVRVP